MAQSGLSSEVVSLTCLTGIANLGPICEPTSIPIKYCELPTLTVLGTLSISKYYKIKHYILHNFGKCKMIPQQH